MNKQSLPQWGWLLIALMITALLANIISVALGVSVDWQIAVVVTMMAPALIYVGVWYEPDRAHYWDAPNAKIFGDLLFVLIGAAIGSGLAIALTIDLVDTRFIRDILAMLGGFILGWVLFWWRNPEIYRPDE